MYMYMNIVAMVPMSVSVLDFVRLSLSYLSGIVSMCYPFTRRGPAGQGQQASADDEGRGGLQREWPHGRVFRGPRQEMVLVCTSVPMISGCGEASRMPGIDSSRV